MKKLISSVMVILLVTGCSTLFQGVITLTSAVDAASKEYAHMYNDGLVTAAVDAKVTQAHAEYQKSAAVAASALRAYKLSGDSTQYEMAFQNARQAALQFIQLIAPLMTNSKAVKFQSQIEKAKVL